MMYTICYGVHVNVKTSSRSVRGNGQDHAEMGTGGAADPCGEDSNQPEGLHCRADCAVSRFTVEWWAGGNQDNRCLPRIKSGPESRPEESAASAGGLLNVAGMLRNEKLARALSDVGFGQFRWQMQYKGILYGTRVVLADRWYPSSKRCSECGYIFDGLTLKDREWPCSHCGAHHDRDVNAARNLKRLATATALPVASSAAMPSTDVAHAVSGGKVTPVIYDFRPQEGSGQEDGCAHFRAQLE